MDKVAKCGVMDNILSFAAFKNQKELKKSDGAKRSRLTGEPWTWLNSRIRTLLYVFSESSNMRWWYPRFDTVISTDLALKQSSRQA